MLSERIGTLYELLQCNNTEIARFAGCSAGNISRIKSGYRVPQPGSRTIALFAAGIYGYADYENLLPALSALCGAADTARDSVIPKLIAWLYETDEVNLPLQTAVPKSRQTRDLLRRSFGKRLDRSMSLLELTNSQLAAMLNIDSSLVSRYRKGIYSPHGNAQLADSLCDILLDRAQKLDKEQELVRLCRADDPGAAIPDTDMLDAESFSHWLYGLPEEDSTEFAQLLLNSLDSFTPGQGLPAVTTDTADTLSVNIAERYWGTDGLRNAVVRFLTEAAENGGELLLYSDEPMDWMAGDREFFALWASLMVRCVKNGVRIKIIHNLDRNIKEMVAAISGWFPLYTSGMIEPYVFRRQQGARFCHTGFLHIDRACIHGTFPSGTGERRWYDYITDNERLNAMETAYHTMLSSASPFLKTYTVAMRAEFLSLRTQQPGSRNYLVQMPPVFTMPEGLLTRILSRIPLSEDRRKEITAIYHELWHKFHCTLKAERINMILFTTKKSDTSVNFSLDLVDLSVMYEEGEYEEHLAGEIGSCASPRGATYRVRFYKSSADEVCGSLF